ncbi:SDR family oxidoreductase [Oerskovia jenensis]|uniref:NAD(P)-dependent dehydrogenase (Short-subunit alcohol dehydrogenase family) n=1 Tax=Oerskovia jenensis TaxID=162169 RepID=A0ABS2LFL4_9CELL|nr:SDR family oxidoreductase [Oerskovia jenensis]MBM7479210.1 NAD(P)-dependent dehydrogenase (short-subunit alcohol dehydrogenase family) [Oerskovia jenensis]
MRTVVVTGTASGIGKALKGMLEADGHRVIGVDLRDADVTVDLTTDAGRAGLVEQVTALSGGTIDAIVANAGLSNGSPATLAVNYFGALATLEGLRPLLAGSDAPRAAVTCSMASLLPVDDQLVELTLAGDEAAALARAAELAAAGTGDIIYGSSKAAVAHWLRRVAPTADWAGAGIPLNAIGPGIVQTGMTAEMLATEESTKAVESHVPMPLGGIMGPEVPANLLRFLVSPENSHMCGQVVFVDGGSDVVIRGDKVW